MDCKHRKESVMLGVRYDDECPMCAEEAEQSRKFWSCVRFGLVIVALSALVVLVSAALGYASGYFFGVGQ